MEKGKKIWEVNTLFDDGTVALSEQFFTKADADAYEYRLIRLRCTRQIQKRAFILCETDWDEETVSPTEEPKHDFEFIKGIISDLVKCGIMDLNDKAFNEWCLSNDFIPWRIREEIVEFKSTEEGQRYIVKL